MEPSVPDYTGRVVGNWRLVGRLGAGSFGAVYEAQNLIIRGRQAAVKVLHPHMALEPDIQRRFINEASAASQADHENIVQVFDGNIEADGLCYLVMELLRGGVTLQKRLSGGPLDVPRLCDLGAQIAGALQAAHDQQIVHRDLKPENIMLVPRSHHPEFVKILDFGVAKLHGTGTGTATGSAVGTPHYMSPEQWQAAPDIDGRADIYSLGIILYECLTGVLPFDAQLTEQWCYFHLHKPLPDPALRIAAPHWLSRLILAMAEKLPADRPQSMAQVRDALLRQAYEGTQAVAARPAAHPIPPGPAQGQAGQARGRPAAGSPGPGPQADPGGATVVGISGEGRRSTLSRGSGQTIPPLPPRRLALMFGLGGLVVAGALLIGRIALRPATDKSTTQPHPGPPTKVQPEPARLPDEMAVLGPGSFSMGRAMERGFKAWPPDSPPHTASVGRFAIGKYEVSMAEYKEFADRTHLTGSLPWDGNPHFDKIAALPVNQITQEQAMAYCRWRYPAQSGRLPSEAEWEFAARDGAAGRRYPFGDVFDPARVNAGRRPARFVPVTGLPAGKSSAGVHNLLGNVAEWTATPATSSPGGPAAPKGLAVVRGGDLMTQAKDLSITARSFLSPGAAGPLVGFRCAFTLP